MAGARAPRGAQVQRLQRHATYGHLKQLVLRMIAEDVLAETETQAADMLSALRCARACWARAPSAGAAAGLR